jgi:CHAT domain-containing protein
MLADDETLLNFAVSDRRLGVFVVDKSSNRFFPLSVSTSELRLINRKLQFVFENTVAGARSLNQNRTTAQAYLRELYDALIAPVRSKLSKSRIIILGDADIAQVPFAALTDESGRQMFSEFDLRLIVNPTDLANVRDERIDFTHQTNAVFAVPSATLPAVGDEGLEISRLFESDVYVGDLATGARLRDALRTADGFVHLAAHASRSSENPLFSRILLGDGPFFPFDLYGTGIQADLITLSGCQTAAPGLNFGNSFSLAKAFYKAGGRYVLASLWPVSDRLTKVFMVDFYSALKESGSVVRSYNDAVTRLQDRTGMPAYWSAFILLGL